MSKEDVQDKKTPDHVKSEKKHKKNNKKLSRNTMWAIKVTIFTLVMAFFVSFLTEITASKSSIIVSVLLLCLLIVINLAFDTIAVAVTACDPAPLMSMAARKVHGAKNAVKLVKNAEKVANICGDIVGDMCGIISGSCAAAIILQLFINNPNSFWFNMLMTSIIAAVTVGGKAFFKGVAINNSGELMLFVGKLLGIFSKKKAKK